MPAETRVAEWISADAGTGASMESGNQIWNPICADLMNAAVKKKKLISSIVFISHTILFLTSFTKKFELSKTIKELVLVMFTNNIKAKKIQQSLNLLKV